MDLSRAESDLSLGLHPNPRAPVADDSISLQIDRAQPPRPLPLPLPLLDHHSDSHRGSPTSASPSADADDSDDAQPEESFSILGYPMCLKRQRRPDSSSCSSASSKRPATTSSSSSAAAADFETRRASVRAWGNIPLSVADPDAFEIMEKEKQRQVRCIELIASENYVCRAVLDALGSHLTNKYSEGLPGARYYGGNQFIDKLERLCCDRALSAFSLDPLCWGVNVQPYSCTSANFAVYTGLLLPKDRIMGLDSPSGGHVSHGYYTPTGKKISGASIFFESFSYKVNPQTGYIDYDKLEERAMDFHPKILICGGSSYPRDWDYARFRHIADKCGAVLMCDMAHISGIVAAKRITQLLHQIALMNATGWSPSPSPGPPSSGPASPPTRTRTRSSRAPAAAATSRAPRSCGTPRPPRGGLLPPRRLRGRREAVERRGRRGDRARGRRARRDDPRHAQIQPLRGCRGDLKSMRARRPRDVGLDSYRMVITWLCKQGALPYAHMLFGEMLKRCRGG